MCAGRSSSRTATKPVPASALRPSPKPGRQEGTEPVYGRVSIQGREIKVGISEQIAEQSKKAIPLGRPGRPEEAAGSVYLFCIPESNYVTGQVLICGGGIGSI